MKQRIITGIVAILIFLPVLIFSSTVALPIAIALCSAVAVYEMSACIGLKRALALSAPFYLAALAFPFLIRYANPSLTVALAAAFATVTLIYLFAALIFSHGKYDLAGVGVLAFTLIYILIGFNAIMAVRDWTVGGKYLYLIAFLGAWITDTFAYFCGMLFGKGGKHKSNDLRDDLYKLLTGKSVSEGGMNKDESNRARNYAEKKNAKGGDKAI